MDEVSGDLIHNQQGLTLVAVTVACYQTIFVFLMADPHADPYF